MNTLTPSAFDAAKDTGYLLIENYLGFRLSYLRQFKIRQFRCATSLLAESSTILQTYPEFDAINEDGLARRLGSALMVYLCFEVGRFTGLDLQSPVKDDDAEFGQPSTGLHEIFNAWRHDPALNHNVAVRDVVSDGNKILTRQLRPDELQFKKRGTGRPNQKKALRRKKMMLSKLFYE